MKIALKLSSQAVGFTEPNPLVGAVVVKDNQVIATGYHRKFGDQHAERVALEEITEEGTTLYVTMEPCTHFGKTPPCLDYIVSKKVKRVVIAMKDPNPVIHGKGIAGLKKMGISVTVGVLSQLAEGINRHYTKFMKKKTPYVALKAGISLDGKLTDKFNKSQWITDEQLRALSHSLRGEFSAILVGVKTVLADNPFLNIREKGWQDKKLFRVILDSQNSLKPQLNIFKDQDQFPLVIFSSQDAADKTPKTKHHFFVSSGKGNKLVLEEILNKLYQLGIASVLVEGGGEVINSFLKDKLADEIIIFQAGTLLGGEESVELFKSGIGISSPLVLKDKEIFELKKGHIIRGFI
jgi:diaminohydroxyphosphoribosylaminopyrimidine deaminase/5-amino-6-(5-phosphoribosylamino)uracil reductase